MQSMTRTHKSKQTGLAVAAVFGVATLFAASGAFAAPPVVQVGDKIQFSDGPGGGNGGSFLITDWGSTGTTNKGSFYSFCLEHNEYMNFGTPRFLVSDISTEARKGGVGGQIALPYPHDPLDNRTAWLYTNYIETPSALNAVAGWSALTADQKGSVMQASIWKIEQEITSFALGSYMTAGMQTVAGNLVAAAGAAGWTNTGRVHVLNLTWYSGGGTSFPVGTYAQDQLYITPVPEPETYAMLLAGLGLMGFVARRRKLKAAETI